MHIDLHRSVMPNTVLPSLSLRHSLSLSPSLSLPEELLTLPELWPHPKRLELLT